MLIIGGLVRYILTSGITKQIILRFQHTKISQSPHCLRCFNDSLYLYIKFRKMHYICKYI